MFTTGSKLLIGSAFAAALFAFVYGVTQEGSLGTIGLVSAAVGLALLAAINVFVRDSNVSAMEPEAFEASAAARSSARPSLWPLLTALGATTVTLGLITNRTFFILGMAAITAGGLGWLVQAWSERASADRTFNQRARNLLIDPIELPIAGAIGAGILIYSFSRIMLGLPSKTATIVAFGVMGAIVLFVGAIVGLKRGASRAAMTGTFGLAAVALIAGGAYAGLNGERETHPHHTPGDIAEENECGAEETEADDLASQSVASKANIAAELTFDGSDLTYDLPGYDGQSAGLTVPRSTPTNIMFHNDGDDDARLVIEMHPRLDDDGNPTGPERICTALGEPGSTQFLTLEFTMPSSAVEGGYEFTVPGTDATLPVVVP
jgi:hypothetical protein